MLKVMLVEDEILVRIGIKSIMNWEEHGYTIIGEASNGAEAMEKIRENVPDIVLTDLVMDKMNGFELIKILRKEYPAVKIIVLSCYNDFDNVREAMRLGASDYIFKLTVKPEELLKNLDTVREQMGPAVTSGAAGERVDKIVHKNLDAIKSKLIRTAIEKSYVSAADCRKELRELNTRVEFEDNYVLFYVSADEFYLAKVNSVIKERELLKFSMLNILSEVFERYETAEVFDYEGGDILVVINVNGSKGEEFTQTIRETFERLHEYMKRYLGISVSGGISESHRGIHELDKAYGEAVTALESRFYLGGGNFYFFRETPAEPEESSIKLPEALDCARLEDLLEHMEGEKAKAFIESFFDFIEEHNKVSRHKIRNRLLDLLYPFIAVAKKRGVELDAMKNECGFTPYQVLTKYESLKQIRKWFLYFVDDFMEECRKRGQFKSREEILKVKEYVKANVDKEIGVSTAAELVNMSESYFSHLFKKETGSSFIDFVNSIKVEKAKELLLQTDLKVYEIAFMVGFENSNYFSMLFKKVTGKSPNDYRR